MEGGEKLEHPALFGDMSSGVQHPLRRLRRATSLASLAVAVLLIALPAHAQTTQTLVSNRNQDDSSTSAFNVERIQPFTTGTNAAGYTLTSVTFRIDGGFGTKAQVTIRDSGSGPGNNLGTLTITQSGRTVTGTSTGIDLAAETTYSVMLSDGISNPGQWYRRTTSDAEDSGAAAGWTIGDSSLWRSDNGNWRSSSTSWSIAIIGSIKAADTAAPTFSSASVNGDKLTITFNEALGTAASLANTAFTVKKTPDGGNEETVSLHATTRPSISGSTVVLTLATAVVPTDGSVKVSYTKPGSGSDNTIKDAAGNETASFSDQPVTNDTVELPTITIAAGTSPVTEGTAATFTVTADSKPGADLTVNLTVADDTDSDFVAAGDEGDKTVTITSSATTATYSVTTQNDSTDEPNGDVTVTVAAGTGYTVGSTSSASVTVNDDDDPPDIAPDFGTATVANQNYVEDSAITNLVLPQATGGNGALTYALTPALPAGLTFTASTRTISGTPTAITAAATYTYKVTDADANTADSDADTLTFTIAVTYGCAGSPAVGGAASGGLVDDCKTLLASEATLVGTGPALDWDIGTAMGSWEGVTVSGGRVTSIMLDLKSLQGSIPTKLADLSSLTRLDLDFNSLTGSIPRELGNLSNLTRLALDNNELTGSIPAELGNLSLTTLYLDSNLLTGCIPVRLGNFAGDINPQSVGANEYDLPVCLGVPVLTLTPGNREINASWTQPEGGTPTGYDLNYKLSTANSWTDASHTGTGRTATIDSLTNGSEYNVRVRAKTATDNGDWSVTESATPRDPPPAFSSASVNGTKLTITFNETLGGATNLVNDWFTVKKTPVGSNEITTRLGTPPAIRGSTVVLTLRTAVVASDSNIKVSYDKPATGRNNRIIDTAGNATDSFGDKPVTNDTPPVISISGGDAVTEGTAAEFTVTANGAPSADLTVNLTVADTTVTGSDFVATTNEGNKTVTITSGTITASYWVDTVDDTTDEDDGDVTVTVATGAGYTVGSPSSATVTVNDDDQPARAAITGVAITSTPVHDANDDDTPDTYLRGDDIDVTVTWDRDVTWDVSANNADLRVRLTIGTTNRSASLVTGGATSGTSRSAKFRYTVVDGDTDSDGLTVTPNNSGDLVLLVNNATVRAGGRGAQRKHAGLTTAQANHLVDGSMRPTAPDTPGTPTVTSVSSTSVSVSWSAPANTGSASSVSDYDLRYFEGTAPPANAADWIREGEANGPPNPGAGTSATITGLTTGSNYLVQVRAEGHGLESSWSASGRGSPGNVADTAPDFGTATAANQDYVVNSAITNLVLPQATGGNGALTYTLTPALPAGLTFNASTRTLSGTPTASKAATTYTYKVTDADSNTADSDADTLTFTIAVTYGCAGSTAVGPAREPLIDDCEALLAMEPTLVGSGSALNWDTSLVMASWTGVGQTQRRVTALRLSSRSLAGSIPTRLKDLTQLTVIELDGNRLTGSIPAELGELSSLTDLHLDNNMLTGSIPAALGNLSNLTTLNLNDNSLSGSIPTVLGNLSSLRTLDLSNNDLDGSIPAELANPSALGDLILSGNQLTGCIPVAIRGHVATINPQQNASNQNVTLPVCLGVPVLTLTPGDEEINASWTLPAGGTPTGYDLNYKLSTATRWTDASHTGTGRTATIDSLTNGSSYNVRVRAKTATDTGDWSETKTAEAGDTAPPTFFEGTVHGDTLTITFNEELGTASNLSNDAFTVKKTPQGGSETDVSLHATTQPSISGKTVVLTLATAVFSTDGSINVAYTKPTSGSNNRIRDPAGNETLSFSDKFVFNSTVPVRNITIAAGTSPVTEGTAATFTITAVGAPSTDLTVSLTVADADDSDFVAASDEGSKTVTIRRGLTTATYSVDTVNDTTDEPNGSVTVTVLAEGLEAAGYVLGSPASASVTVNDDDDTTAPAFSSASVNGDKLTITFDEALAAAGNLSNDAFTVKKTPTGGREAEVSLSSTAPSISGSTVVLTLATAVVASDGSVKVSYTKPSGGTNNKIVDAAGNATDSFADQSVTNDTLPVITISGGSAVTEGTAAVFTVTSDAAVSANLVVNLTVADDTSSDFVDDRDEGAKTVTIAWRTNSATYSVDTENDTTDENNGVVKVTVATGAGYTVGSPDSATVAVNDNDGGDDTDPPTFSSASVNGDKLTITFNETLGAASGLTNLSFTVKKTPSGGSEAEVSLSTSTAPAISGSTVVLTLATAVVSTDGGVKVSYLKPTFGTKNRIIDAVGNETLDFSDEPVTNNTGGLPVITIARGTSPVTEGTAATFTVTASPAPSANLSVNLTVADADGSDFVAAGDEGDKTVTISSGDTTATYSVTTQGDSNDEQDGNVTVTVASGTGYTVGSPSSASVTVNDDDDSPLPVITIAAGTSPVTEGTAAEFTVTTSNLPSANLTVNLSVADAGGTSDFV
ncbi:MAG: hypothetical protein F4X98_14770, partial [Gammaproteobacteria bacterium]|nr:hypothetical protein [Gammaproteobacteria bacterium]